MRPVDAAEARRALWLRAELSASAELSAEPPDAAASASRVGARREIVSSAREIVDLPPLEIEDRSRGQAAQAARGAGGLPACVRLYVCARGFTHTLHSAHSIWIPPIRDVPYVPRSCPFWAASSFGPRSGSSLAFSLASRFGIVSLSTRP